jgi:hypothetical protein
MHAIVTQVVLLVLAADAYNSDGEIIHWRVVAQLSSKTLHCPVLHAPPVVP